MDKKTIKTLAVIFIGLLLIIVELNWLEKSSDKKNVIKADFSLEKTKNDNTQKITIIKNNEKNEIVKTEEGWKIADAKKTEEEMKSFFEVLGKVKIKSVASKNSINDAGFGFTEAEMIELSVVNNSNEDQVILIGKMADTGGFYIKKKDSKIIYLAEGDIRSAIESIIKKPVEEKKAEKK